MTSEYRLAGDAEIQKRLPQLDKLFECLCEKDMWPWYTSDKATVFEVSYDMPAEIIQRIQACYGVMLTVEELSLPVWRVLDLLSDRSHHIK